MRRAHRKMWRAVPCMSRKYFRTDSWKDTEEILKSKLAIIKEEPETCEENLTPPRLWRLVKKGQNKMGSKLDVARHFRIPNFSLKESYCLFIPGFAPKSR
ncbi:hypothetical protein D8674_023914 [Pyrus ussuriensis x Pyrus communis]|uniref:Uncharacterized protein n=1 Tax=Pyrus ussuriensis x Pyrus communis TaxID=2448454 RepID=A0A5N5H6J9_9ROSA|nr:hypothetical protein D8674_023914 [Pyrus ussuriensis x Pyrus communis]